MGIIKVVEKKLEKRRDRQERELNKKVASQQKELSKVTARLEKKNIQRQQALVNIRRLQDLKAQSKELKKATFAAKHPRAVAIGKSLSAAENRASKAIVTGAKATGRFTAIGAKQLAKEGIKVAAKQYRKSNRRVIRVKPRGRVIKSNYRGKPRKRSKKRSSDDISDEWFKI